MSLSAFARRHRTLFLSLAGAFVVFTLAGFFLVPVIARGQVLRRASAALHRPVAIERVRFNPFTLALTLRGVTVTDHDNAELAGWDELTVNLAASSLLRRTWFFDSIRLVHPHARIVLGPDGQPNIADLLATDEAPAPKPAVPAASVTSAALPPVVVIALLVERGEFVFLDRSRGAPFETRFSPFTLDLRRFTTRPDRTGNYAFEAVTESGERFAWRGNFSVAPLASAGHFELGDLTLAKYAPFSRSFVQLAPTGGKLTVGADYEVRLDPTPVLRLANGALAITGLQLTAPGAAAPAITATEIRLDNLTADAVAHTTSAGSLLLRGANITAERRADGTIDLVALLAPPVPAPAPPPATVSPAPAFSATLAKLEIADTTLRLTDRTTPRPATLAVDQLALTLTNVGTALDRDVPLAASFRWNESGRIALHGTVRPQPLAASLDIEADGIALRPLDPYLAPFLDVLITSGTARAKGHADVALPAGAAPDLRWTGDFGLAGFATIDAEFSEPLFGFADLALTGIKFTSQPLTLALDEVALREPFAHIVVMPDRQVNLTAALKPLRASQPETQNPKPENSPAPALSPPPSRLSPQLSLARVTITGARFTATDRSIDPVFNTELTDFGGTITGLSSDPAARAAADLTGRLGPAQLHITGQLNLLAADAFSDVQVAFNGIELPPFTPYSGRYAGYVIDKGKLNLDLRYRLEKRDLTAENNFALDQFTFGQPVASPDAIKLPLKLALAILRDRNGRISESLPVRGNLDDPDFRYGRVVWHAVTNVIVKAATAPFSILGGLFGGGHDLSAVDFASGSAEFDAEATARLDGLVKALTERPGLNLEIASAPQPAADTAGLRASLLDAQLRARKVRELAATTSEAIDPATVAVTPEEEQRYLAALLAERGVPVVATATTPDAAPQPPSLAKSKSETSKSKAETQSAKPNFVVRTVRRLFGTTSSSAANVSGPHGRPADAPPDSATPALPPVEDLRTQVLATITPTEADFAALSARRAQRIQEYLTGKGVDAAHVFLAPNAAPPSTDPAAPPRVVFNLQ
jgi:hypothetical protein